MAAAWVIGAIILILILGTYALHAVLIALQVVVWLLGNVVFPVLVFLGWIIVLPFRPKAAKDWMRDVVRQSRSGQRG